MVIDEQALQSLLNQMPQLAKPSEQKTMLHKGARYLGLQQACFFRNHKLKIYDFGNYMYNNNLETVLYIKFNKLTLGLFIAKPC